MSYKKAALIVLALGVITHTLWFGNPPSAVFDEVHFGKFVSAYFTHEYYFDIHPPLGKLIIAGWGNIWGFNPGFSFANIGEAYPDKLYLALRFLPSLAGALLPLVVFGIAIELGIGIYAATLAGSLVAFDNALLAQSRLILLDPFLLLFGFGAVWCYLVWRKRRASYWLLILSGALIGAAASIKWTGITFFAIIGILEIIRLFYNRNNMSPRKIILSVTALFILPIAVYAGSFAVHFSLLNKPGSGDAFMPVNFQSTSFVDKFTALNKEMYRSNQRLSATHPYSSQWYTWPFLVRPIFYWTAADAKIYLIGNPFIWWASTAAIITMLGIALRERRMASSALIIIIGAWLINLLPFIGIGRVMFLYHYLPALVWAIIGLAWLVDRFPNPRKMALGFGAVALIVFVFFAPLSYGLPMSERATSLRIWMSSWR